MNFYSKVEPNLRALASATYKAMAPDGSVALSLVACGLTFESVIIYYCFRTIELR